MSQVNGDQVNMSLFHKNVLTSLRNLWKNQLLTDIIVQAGSISIKAHRCVLAASSEYFKASLTSSFKESEIGSVIVLQNIDPACLDSVLNYIYFGEINLHESTILSILDAGKI